MWRLLIWRWVNLMRSVRAAAGACTGLLGHVLTMARRKPQSITVATPSMWLVGTLILALILVIGLR